MFDHMRAKRGAEHGGEEVWVIPAEGHGFEHLENLWRVI
jgi:hypothetical protein